MSARALTLPQSYFEMCIQNGIGYLIAQLVRMPLADGLGSKKEGSWTGQRKGGFRALRIPARASIDASRLHFGRRLDFERFDQMVV